VERGFVVCRGNFGRSSGVGSWIAAVRTDLTGFNTCIEQAEISSTTGTLGSVCSWSLQFWRLISVSEFHILARDFVLDTEFQGFRTDIPFHSHLSIGSGKLVRNRAFPWCDDYLKPRI
jgi:hypothetical protein